jgi:lipid-A-disaccharide synthase
MIVAGEASGDLHGGNLARAIIRQAPDTEIFGIGGREMRLAGVDTIVDNADLAVIGLWEVLSHFGVIKAAFNRMSRMLREDPPDVLVLIDYPDFNLRLAKVARAAGVRVAYYISPQIWAWRRGRLKKMKGIVDRMFVVFPFEKKFYDEAGIPCSFVGNPLLDSPSDGRSRQELAGSFGMDPDRPVLGLLPGSRKKELAFHLPVMLRSYAALADKIPGLQCVIPVAASLTLDDFSRYISAGDDKAAGIRLVENDSEGVMEFMDAAVVASGTATLQTALHRKPMVIIYRLSGITYFIGRMLISVPFIGMVNLIAEEGVVPELIQHAATQENIISLIYKMFCDKAYYDDIVAKLDMVRQRLGGPGASERVAQGVIGLID